MRKGSRESASQAIEGVLRSEPKLPFGETVAPRDASQDGRRRLSGAWELRLDRIESDPEQPRKQFDDRKQGELVASIREVGVELPIKVWWTGEKYRIIHGHRRFDACQRIGLESIPVIEERPEEGESTIGRKRILVKQIVENWQREDFDQYDLSDALAELRDRHGYSQVRIAKLTGKAESEVSRLLSLQRIDPSLQQELRCDNGKTFTRRHLFAIASLSGSEAQKKAVDEIRDGGLSAVEIEQQLSRKKPDRATGRKSSAPPVTLRRFKTTHALVTITFRSKDVSPKDVSEALREALAQSEDASDRLES